MQMPNATRRIAPPGPEANALAPTSLVHRDPRGFRDPDRFEPERWLAAITPSWPFFPFGGSSRRCVGEPLATVLVSQRSLLVRASRA